MGVLNMFILAQDNARVTGVFEKTCSPGPRTPSASVENHRDNWALVSELEAGRLLRHRFSQADARGCAEEWAALEPPKERNYPLRFPGLSCEYPVQELRRQAGEEADGRVVIAHLGNGASMTAIKKGKSVDTTMGFTPAGGLVMSTRSGDLDPGVVVYLLEEEGVKVSELNEMVNRKSGLLGISGISSDMKDVLEKEKEDPRAAVAVDLFRYQAKKFLAALAGVLGGLDTLIFTAGVGENAPTIR